MTQNIKSFSKIVIIFDDYVYNSLQQLLKTTKDMLINIILINS